MKKFIEKIENLDNIHQWSERDSIIKESVSQHSFKVSAIAVYLLEKIDSDINGFVSIGFRWNSYRYKVLSYAILHDFDEAIFGRDVSHIVKYNSFNGDDIRKAIDEYVNHILDKEFSGLIPDLPPVVRRFVKLCDWLALLTFCKRNKKMGAKSYDAEETYCINKITEAMKEIQNLFNFEFGTNIDFNNYIKINDL